MKLTISCQQARAGRGIHGLPKVSPRLTMPNPSTPCGRATPQTALRLFGGWPARRAGGLRPSSSSLDTPSRTGLAANERHAFIFLFSVSDLEMSSSSSTSSEASFGGDWTGRVFLYEIDEDMTTRYETDTNASILLKKVADEDQRAVLKSVRLYASELPDIPKALVPGIHVGVQVAAAAVVIAGAAALGASAPVSASAAAAATATSGVAPFVADAAAAAAAAGSEIKDDFLQWLKTHGVAINDSIFHHVTVVLETNSESGIQKFWSFEKMTHGIVILCATTEERLLEKCGDVIRKGVYELPLETDDCKPDITITSLLNWIFDNGEQRKVYNIRTDNCQYFGQRVFDSVAQVKTYPSKLQIEQAIVRNITSSSFSTSSSTSST
jgi:hypothetical protein